MSVLDAIARTEPEEPTTSPAPPAARVASASGSRAEKWADSALYQECCRVQNAGKGTRNNTLNLAALALGQIVGGGYLKEDDVVRELSAAALACGLGKVETKKTIASGLKKGKTEPRHPAPLDRVAESATLSPPFVDDPDDDGAVGPSGPEPPPMPGDDEMPPSEGFRVTRIEIIDADAIFAELEPPDYLMDGIIVRGTITEIIAYGYSGKSWLGINAVNSVGAGVPWLERFPTTLGNALFMDYESGKYECRRRMKLDALGRDLVTPIAGVSLVTMPALYMTDPAFASEMERLMDGRALLVLDTLKAANPKADENSSEVRVGLDYMRRPLERTGCAGVVLAHAKKTSGSVTTIDPREAGRGSSAIFDAADAVLHVTYTEGEPLRVQQTKARCGKAVAPFLVEIIDTPNGGVRVAAKDEQTADTATDSARFEKLCRGVLALVREHPGASGRVLREHAGSAPSSVIAALEVLERDGAVRNAGTERKAKWFPTGVMP